MPTFGDRELPTITAALSLEQRAAIIADLDFERIFMHSDPTASHATNRVRHQMKQRKRLSRD